MESQIQKKLIKILEKEGWFCLKLIKTSKNGIPDLFAQKSKYSDFYCEVKSDKGQIEVLQLYRLSEISLSTDAISVIFWPNYKEKSIFYFEFEIKVIRTFKEFKEFINKIKTG